MAAYNPPPLVALLTYGSRGDVEPFVALGVALNRAGYRARLFAPSEYAGLARAYAVDFIPIPGSPSVLAQAMTDRAGLSWPRLIANMIRHILPLAVEAFRIMEQHTRDAALIIHSFMMTDAGHTIAHRLGIPDLSAQLFPVFISTAQFPAVALPDPRLGLFRRFSHTLNTAVFRTGGRLLYRWLRRSAPDLPGLAPWPFGRGVAGSTPILFGYSPHVLPPPTDWSSYAQVTGYWQLDPPPGWEPPAALVRFIENGPPPIYIGAGSMRSVRLRSLMARVASAVLASGQRAVLCVPPEVAASLPTDLNLFAVEDVPHAWLFPRMRFIIHHGGAGTTGSAVRAGVSSTAVPFTADQAFWARRIEHLHLGPRGAPFLRLTAAGLASIIEQAATNPAYAINADQLGRLVRAEDGAGAVVSAVNQRLKS